MTEPMNTGLLRLGALTLPISQEPFTLGSISVDAVEPFALEGLGVIVDTEEAFELGSEVSVDAVEPFDLGETVAVQSIEPFSISSAQDAYLGVDSPASPKLGWRQLS